MIHHLHSLFPPETNTPAAGPKSHATESKSTLDSFHGALSEAVKPDAVPSREPANPGSISSQTLVRPPAPPNGGYDPFLQAAYSNPFASLSTPTTSASTTGATTAAPTLDAQQTFDNSYWASQPAAVQALRTMQDPGQRTAVATQLASEGYSIDVPIMVWGWDPSIVTSMRQAEGYTWVPSAMQNPVQVLPGLPAMGTMAAYNPKNPPAGSIAV